MIRVETRGQEVVGEAGPVGGHEVVGFDGADGDDVLVRPRVAHDADGLHRQQDGESLGDPTLEPGVLQLVEEDGVGLAEHVEAGGGHLAEAADSQPGAGERMAPDQGIGQTQLDAQPADLVLEQVAQGSISSKPSSAGSPPTLWWILIVAVGPSGSPPLSMTSGYNVPWARNRAPGIDRAASRKTSMNVWPIRRRFSCGSVTPSRAFRKGSAASTTRSSASDAAPKRLGDRGPLAAAQKPRVDEDADDPRPEGPGQQRRADRRIDAAGQAANDPVGRPDPARELGQRTLDERPHRPGPGIAADPVEEVAQDQRAIGRVRHLGVELETVDRPVAVADRGDRAGRRGRQREEVAAAAWIWSPWLIQTIVSCGTSWNSGSSRSSDAALGAAELAPRRVGLDLAPIASQISCIP